MLMCLFHQAHKVCPNNELIQHCFHSRKSPFFQIWSGRIKRPGTGHRWTRNCVGRSTEIFHNFSELKVILEFKRSSYFLVPAHVYSGADIYSTQDICPMLKKYFFETCYLVLSIKDNIKSLFYIIISILWLLSVAEIFCSRFWVFESWWE